MGKRQRRRLREQYRVLPRPRPDLELHRDPTGEATARLKDLVDQLARLQLEIDTEIDLLYGWGFDWPTIARALGVTRQAARQRYLRRHVE
ncbi:MAG TPA: hypothetical protein VHA79_03060 [Mycobacteriales bacterium]|nr:hypothetical protein [Mycobacteriales bacterium]